MIVLNDIHLATQRQAGTTPASQLALKDYIRDEFNNLVNGEDGYAEASAGGTLLLNGDLFDGFSVDPSEVIAAAEVLDSFITVGGNIVLGMGNHDASAKGDRTSSFHLLAYIMESRHPSRVQVVDHTCGFTQVVAHLNAWMIPHMLNQDLFDIEVAKATEMKVETGYLFLHCNIMSPFAEHSDHSLNLVESQVEALVEAGWTIVVGHEHQARYVHGKRVIITGNQIQTSVADCLNNPGMKKQRMRITSEGWLMEDVLNLAHIYAEVDWREIGLRSDLDDLKFIRVAGNCTAEEAADMVSRVAKLRQASQAFVISNAVKVDGVAQMEGLAEMSMENVSKFDVLGALLEELSEREQNVVKELLK